MLCGLPRRDVYGAGRKFDRMCRPRVLGFLSKESLAAAYAHDCGSIEGPDGIRVVEHERDIGVEDLQRRLDVRKGYNECVIPHFKVLGLFAGEPRQVSITTVPDLLPCRIPVVGVEPGVESSLVVACMQVVEESGAGDGTRTRDVQLDLLALLTTRIRTAQLRASVTVNQELVLLYWGIGREILTRQREGGWGAKVIERLANDLRREFPDMQGLSPRNLGYMKAFAEGWPDEAILQAPLAELTCTTTLR